MDLLRCRRKAAVSIHEQDAQKEGRKTERVRMTSKRTDGRDELPSLEHAEPTMGSPWDHQLSSVCALLTGHEPSAE